MDAYDFADRTVIVTGGARGLGRNHSLAFARLGADVAVFDVRTEAAAAVVEEIESEGTRGLAVACDVADAVEVEGAVDHVAETLGPVDVLVNNAGISRFGRLTDLDVETWREVLEVNLTGSFLCAKHVAAHMVECGTAGAIVNTASMFGHRAVPGLGAYGASKFGVRALTKTLAVELADHDITVTAVSPIGVETDAVEEYDERAAHFLGQGTTYAGRYNLLDPGSRLDPDAVTDAVVWLASDRSRYVTGHSLPVDAGGLV